MTWVTLCSNDMGNTFALGRLGARLNKLANSWTAEPPFVQARAPKPPGLTPGEGRRKASSLTDNRGGSHLRQILRVKQAYQLSFEVNFVAGAGDCLESHQLAHKGASDKTLTPLPFDVTAIAHPPHFPPKRILRLFEPSWHLTRTPLIKTRRHFLAQRFVRTLCIVATDPGPDPSLLCPEGRSWRSGGIGLQNPMHLFVRAVVLGMRPASKLHRNAQTQPPHAQTRHPQCSLASKRRSVVCAHLFGQTVAAKNRQECLAHRRLALIGQKYHRQHKATVHIAHRKRFAASAIAGAKPPFEIHTPHLVAVPRDPQPSPRQHRTGPSAPLALAYQIGFLQPQPQSAHRRNALCLRKTLLQQPSQLLWAPVWTRFARSTQTSAPKRAMRFCAVMRPTRSVPQCPDSPRTIAPEPFVTALAADPKPTTQRRERLPFFPAREDKSRPRLRHQNFFPRHRCPRKCHLCH